MLGEWLRADVIAVEVAARVASTSDAADPVVASAIVDRLLNTATVLNIRGHSYRMRSYVDQQAVKQGGGTVR